MKLLRTDATGFRSRLARYCREAASGKNVGAAVASVIEAVRKEGDKAVLRYTKQFDKAELKLAQLKVSADEMKDSAKSLAPAQRRALRDSLRCVQDFHRKTLPKPWRGKNPHGATVGEEFYPIQRVGLYVPGGQVPLASTVIMSVTLAKLAGCPEICVCTPPKADSSVDPGLLAALQACGATEVYRVGGIQAIAAMAYGTKRIPAVDKVYGPGNAFVTEAKRQLFGVVGVDLLPGPSEVLILADETARADFIAADLLAQAEHGSGKEKVYFVTTHEPLVAAVESEIKEQAETLSHAKQALAVLKKSLAIVAKDMKSAVEAANFVAPEHMELHVAPAARKPLIKQIKNAGALLIGAETPTVLGDFTAGPSHTLPTDRTGRFFSGLQVTDFMRRTSIVHYDKRSAAKAWPTVKAFSELEQLDAHGRSLQIRLED